MNQKRLHIINGIIFLTLLGINLIIYKNRDNGYAYKEYLSYNQLYQPSEALSLAQTQFNGKDSLTLLLSNQQNNDSWKVQLPDSTHYTSKGNPAIKLQEGIKDYTLTSKGLSINIRLNFISEQSYQKNGRDRKSDVELMQVSIPIQNTKSYPLNYWAQSSEFTTADEIELAKKLLSDSMHIIPTENSISKIQKIGSYIIKKIGSQIGTPNDSMDVLSPLKQFNYAQQHTSKVWCGNFVNIFSFFANTANIPARSVWIEGDANGISTAGHNFNECYIKESNQWIFTDLMWNMLYVQTKDSTYLNSVDFYNAYQLHSKDLVITTFNSDSLAKTEFDYAHAFYANYFHSNVGFVYYKASQFDKQLYSFSKKIKRYLFKDTTFSLYSGNTIISNGNFYKKHMFFFGLLFFILYWIIATIVLTQTNKR